MGVDLKKWCVCYKRELIRLCNEIDRSYLSNRLPLPYKENDADWWIDFTSKEGGLNGVFRAILLDGRVVGNISVEKKKDVFEKDAEIGYMLLEEESSHGYMTDAVSQICEIAFSELDIVRITGLVHEPNTASRKVLEKNGFELEGIMKNAIYKNERLYNLCVYGKYRDMVSEVTIL